MGKDDILIATVANTILFPTGKHPEGFIPHAEQDLRSVILNNSTFTRRGDAEVNFTMKQPIAYAVVQSADGRIFAYQRTPKRTGFHETRLAGKWSCGLGGHIEKEDLPAGAQLGDFLERSLVRELEEEISLNGSVTGLEILGYINSEQNEVGRVHIGALYLIKTSATAAAGSEEVSNEGFFSREELTSMLRNPEQEWENWTQIALQALWR